MANTLTGLIKDTKGDVLHVSNSGSGLTTSLQTVYDGAGNASTLSLSTTSATAGNISFTTNTISTSTGALTVNSNSTALNLGTASGSTVILGNSSGTTTINGTVSFGGSVTLVLSNPYTAGTATVTLGNNFTTSGNFALTLTQTGATNVTLPTTGTLATLAGSETFTNKTLTTPIISTISNTGTLTLPTSTDTLVGKATTDTLTNKTLTSPVLNGTITGTGIMPLAQGGSGYANAQALVQRAHTTIASTSGTSTIPLDNTIPQNTEGSQITTLSITPKNTANRLVIHCHIPTGNLSSAYNIIALFQDSTANALACQDTVIASANYHYSIDLWYEMAAGTTSSTTFTVRMGSNTGTWYLMDNALANFGGVLVSNAIFEILEYTA